MKHLILSSLVSMFATMQCVVAGNTPKKYGVNLGSWLVLEPWMLPAVLHYEEWEAMGGEMCAECSQCAMSEFTFTQKYPDTADQAFAKHWSTWFTQDDVNQLQDAGINTVRVPLGYWIVEALVDRETEFYPRGGIKFLSNGVKMLRDANMRVILDHHALPGVQTANQMFTGHCTSDVQFYTDYNYGRALTWTAVMTALTHLHANFASIFAIEAVNEPIMDASQTPGYGDFQKNFVKTVRAIELLLGIPLPNHSLPSALRSMSLTASLPLAAQSDKSGIFNDEVMQAVENALPILLGIGQDLGLEDVLDVAKAKGRGGLWEPLTTNFMDVNWQYNDPPNPADAAIGPQAYDNHLYYNFGGVADPNPDAYMTSICNLQRVQNDAAVGDSPLWFGEWALPTQFNATDKFLHMWADAQKLAYSQGAGWLYWNFDVERSELAGDLARQVVVPGGFETWLPNTRSIEGARSKCLRSIRRHNHTLALVEDASYDTLFVTFSEFSLFSLASELK
ncbi:hypothetical protein EW146_g8839 [Bondarzewia mesenterica]|uniref:Glycoside hydrolase family 5 domain-containing protein n=1 Tax=Bondarzewia mesenterica TaxID=1095465 RepID=A0A4S4LB14_9AGAM|nr:hypothetical protein EW146_g8839 [Bondarzewia mesenterica]